MSWKQFIDTFQFGETWKSVWQSISDSRIHERHFCKTKSIDNKHTTPRSQYACTCGKMQAVPLLINWFAKSHFYFILFSIIHMHSREIVGFSQLFSHNTEMALSLLFLFLFIFFHPPYIGLYLRIGCLKWFNA